MPTFLEALRDYAMGVDEKEASGWVRGALLALVAILGGGGGSLIVTTIKDPRPDPYTGRDSLRDKVEIYKRLDRKRDAIDKLEEKIHRIELEHRDFKAEIKYIRELLVSHFQEDAKEGPLRPH